MEKFYCSAKEFYFNREFSNERSIGQGKLNEDLETIRQKSNGRAYNIVLVGIVTLIILFIVPRLGAFPFQTALRIGLALIFLMLLISFYVQLYKGRKAYTSYVDYYFNAPISLKENVLYYVITNKGLYINDYNREQLDEMILFPWDEIEKVEMDYVRLAYANGVNRNKAKSMFENTLRSIQKKHPGFDLRAEHFYKDRFSLRLYSKTRKGIPSSVAIPKEWRETGEETRFLEEMEKFVPVDKSAVVQEE